MLLGPADEKVIKESVIIINQILTKLKADNKINPNYKRDFSKLDKLLRYSDECATSLSRIENAITKDKFANFNILKNDLVKHNISESNILTAYGALIFNQFLLFYAHLGNILVCLLSGVSYTNAKGDQQKVTGTEPLGPLLSAIHSLTNVDLKKVIDNEFRNALAHGWYYFENGDTLIYFTDGTLANKKSMSLDELYIKQIKLWHFVAGWGLQIEYFS